MKVSKSNRKLLNRLLQQQGIMESWFFPTQYDVIFIDKTTPKVVNIFRFLYILVHMCIGEDLISLCLH